MTRKIYYGSKPVYITEAHNEKLKEAGLTDKVAYLEASDGKGYKKFISELEKAETESGYICGKNADVLMLEFADNFEKIEAAGGIIQNSNKDILFIFRRGFWDLPKGKIDEGENEEQAALREIEEETGLNKLSLKHKIGKTYHIYQHKGQTIFKTTHWFHCIAEDNQALIPQTSEDIEEIKWFKTKDIKVPTDNTYQNIRDILAEFFNTP